MAKKTAKKAARKVAKKSAKKSTSSKAAKPKAGKGTRYSTAAKQKIVAFVEQVNEAKGRGGVAAAARKFGVSPLSIGNWLRKAGVNGVSAAKPGRGKSSGGARDRVLNELTTLNHEIAQKRSELEALEARFSKLKGEL